MRRDLCRRVLIQTRLAAVTGCLFVSAILAGASAEPTTQPQEANPGPNEVPSPALPEQPAPQRLDGSRQNAPQQPNAAEGLPAEAYAGGISAAVMLGVPITRLLPGNVPPPPGPSNPVEGQSQAIQRGMTNFVSFNCVGCHAPSGGGGMGPALSNSHFIYGGEAANIYLSIYQGRPNGMPAWGSMLPDNIIWDMVAYIRSISKEPSKSWGKTLSRDAMTEQQVPAEYVESTTPWGSTEKFSAGQKPDRTK